MARNQVRPNVGQQLKVVPPSLHDSLLLQQQELQAQQKLGINKQINQIPKPQDKTKTQPKPRGKANRLEAPYKQGIAKPSQQVEQKRSKADLKKQKEEMLHWLNNVRIG